MLADMVEDDERSAIDKVDRAVHPYTTARPASNPTAPPRSSRTSRGPFTDPDADGRHWTGNGESSRQGWRGQ